MSALCNGARDSVAIAFDHQMSALTRSWILRRTVPVSVKKRWAMLGMKLVAKENALLEGAPTVLNVIGWKKKLATGSQIMFWGAFSTVSLRTGEVQSKGESTVMLHAKGREAVMAGRMRWM